MPTNRTATPSNVDYSPITQAMIEQSRKDEEALRLRRKKQADNRKRNELDEQISSTETDIATFNSHEKLAKAAYDKAINEITKNRTSATKRLEDLKSKRSALGKPEEVETDPDDEEPAPAPKPTAPPAVKPQEAPKPEADPTPKPATVVPTVVVPEAEEKPKAEPKPTAQTVVTTVEPKSTVQPLVEAPKPSVISVPADDGFSTLGIVPNPTSETPSPKKKATADDFFAKRLRSFHSWVKDYYLFHKGYIGDIVNRKPRPSKVKYIAVLVIILILAFVIASTAGESGHPFLALIAFIVIAAGAFVLARKAVTPRQ